jgi:hypothetical protein
MVSPSAALRVSHYDRPSPDQIDPADAGDLETLRDAGAFRFANRLVGWIDVVDGKVVDHGAAGTSLIGSTTVSLGVGDLTVAAVPLPDLTPPPECLVPGEVFLADHRVLVAAADARATDVLRAAEAYLDQIAERCGDDDLRTGFLQGEPANAELTRLLNEARST